MNDRFEINELMVGDVVTDRTHGWRVQIVEPWDEWHNGERQAVVRDEDGAIWARDNLELLEEIHRLFDDNEAQEDEIERLRGIVGLLGEVSGEVSRG